MSEQKEKIVRIVREQLGLRDDEIVPTANLIEDLGADSLDMIELCMALEEDFDIEIPDEEFEPVTTVQDLFDLIEKRVK